jgi:hypothetical protein
MRSIDRTFVNDLNHGVLKSFLTSVKLDDALCLEIRNNYINIYYRGGNLFRITSEKGMYKVYFDPNYAKEYCKPLPIINPTDYPVWINNIPILKSAMDSYFIDNQKHEREFQQLVERDNNYSSIATGTDYFIADIEYANSDNGSRFDMLAVKWKSQGRGVDRKDPTKATLSFIEMKYGDSALRGKSGIQTHVADLLKFLSNNKDRDQIVDEVNSLFEQKLKLGLIPNISKPVDIQHDCPLEFVLLIGNHNPSSTILGEELGIVRSSTDYQDLIDIGCEIKIAKASLMGYGLYDDCIISLDKYLKSVKPHGY